MCAPPRPRRIYLGTFWEGGELEHRSAADRNVNQTSVGVRRTYTASWLSLSVMQYWLCAFPFRYKFNSKAWKWKIIPCMRAIPRTSLCLVPSAFIYRLTCISPLTLAHSLAQNYKTLTLIFSRVWDSIQFASENHHHQTSKLQWLPLISRWHSKIAFLLGSTKIVRILKPVIWYIFSFPFIA